MRTSIATASLASAILAAAVPVRSQAFAASYLHQLTTTGGPLASSVATLAYDPFHHELYVISAGVVRVFNAVGMEIYAWPEDPALGSVWGVAPLEDGDVLALRYQGPRPSVLRCNFRGEPVEELQIDGLSSAFASDFRPQAIVSAQGKVLLADRSSKQVLIVDLASASTTSVDLAALLGLDERHKDDDIDGFTVDGQGNLVVTVAAAFKVFVVAPDGTVRGFGRSGSAPGKFGTVKGVAVDEAGHFYVADRLKSAVMVFDQEFKFLGEFGHAGNRPGSLYSPYNVLFAEGRLYVSQQARRGVAVFQISHDQESTSQHGRRM